MPNANDIATIIGTVGFPIVMCGALFWYMVQQNKNHKEETNALKDAVNELRIAITKLCERIGGTHES